MVQKEKDRCIGRDWAGKLESEKEDTPNKSDWNHRKKRIRCSKKRLGGVSAGIHGRLVDIVQSGLGRGREHGRDDELEHLAASAVTAQRHAWPGSTRYTGGSLGTHYPWQRASLFPLPCE